MLSDRRPFCPVLSVCNVGVLWPNGWTDQDETCHAHRPRPWPHSVRWGPSFTSPKGGGGGAPKFLAHICCSEMAAGIKMPLGVEVGLHPGDFVFAGDPTPPSPKGSRGPRIFRPCLLWPKGCMDQDGSWHGGRPQPRQLHVRWGPIPLSRTGGAPLPNFRPISIVAKRLDASRWYMVWR